ncbi:MAG: methyltransferase domain-containing protein [Hyphomicrobiales bacterium]|nr:methyltransferase domain-containing protein [Hyphomicrobiales bacterium]
MSESQKALARDLRRVVNHSTAGWKRLLSREIYRRSKGVVAAGLFRGMRIQPEMVREEGDLAAKLVGCYEQELEPAFRKASQVDRDLIVNIGCAEGYYAVGLARLNPEAKVVAFDIEEAACKACRQNAELNGVGDRVEARTDNSPEKLRGLLMASRNPLLVVDCEGAERDMLDPTVVRELAQCDIVVECHDFVDRSITNVIRERFAETHEIQTIRQGARDPHESALLRGFAELDLWLAVCENRPESMHWLVMRRNLDCG